MAELKKVLSFPAILLITINSIMGTGIYFLPAVGAGIAGPASLISWVILSIIAIYIGMCFAELSSMFPKAGGVYEYSKQAYGRFPSFLIGWITLIVGNVTIAMLVVGAIQYLLPYHMPLAKTVISLLFIFIFNFIAFRGMKVSAFMLMTFAILTLIMVFSLILPGFLRFDLSNFFPFFVYPASTIFFALFFIAETFFGWESASFLAEETKNPQKIMPKALTLGTISIAVIALLLVISAIGGVGWQKFAASSAPLAELGKSYFGFIGESIFTLSVYLAIIGAVACWVVSAPRLVLALSRDRLFLTQFAKIHPKFNTPYMAILFQTVITSILVIKVSGAYRSLLILLIPLAIITYSFVLFALFLLRIKKPKLKREFKVPFGKIGPLLVILFNIFLLVMWLTQEEGAYKSMFLGLSFIFMGIPVYFLLEMYYNPKMIRFVNDIFAYLILFTERIALPLKVRKEMIELLGNIKGKVILEFGCSVGTLTLHLAEEVGSNGKIYATDLSKRETLITQKRIEKKGHKHVFVLHDEKHHSRVHPDIPEIHTVASVGMLGYLQDTNKVLRDLNKRLKNGSKICFVDYDNFFGIIPNVEWLSNDKKIKRIFNKNGFKVDVKRKQGFAWKYIFIYGTKVRNVS